MADIITTGTSDYPTTLDTATTLTDGSSGSEIVSPNYNGPANAVIAVETELGTDPAGAYTDVKTRLDTLDTSITDLTAASATITNKRSGDLVQYLAASITGVTTTGPFATISIANNPFASTMGTSFGDSLLVNIKPTSVLNDVYALLTFQAAGTATVVAGLFLAGSTSAITACAVGSSTAVNAGSFLWQATTVSAATTAYLIRFAYGASSGTATINGIARQALFNNSLVSTLAVYEVQN
jgi:hypothetical protein